MEWNEWYNIGKYNGDGLMFSWENGELILYLGDNNNYSAIVLKGEYQNEEEAKQRAEEIIKEMGK